MTGITTKAICRVFSFFTVVLFGSYVWYLQVPSDFKKALHKEKDLRVTTKRNERKMREWLGLAKVLILEEKAFLLSLAAYNTLSMQS